MTGKYLLLLAGITWACHIYGGDSIPQNGVKLPFFRVILDNGRILQQNQPFLESTDKDGHTFNRFLGLTGEVGWQTVSGKSWYAICNFPRVGIGARYININNRSELGHPLAAYGFFEGTLYRNKRVSLTTRYSLGVGYSKPEYGTHDTLINDILSTYINMYVGLGAGMHIRLNNYLSVEPLFRLSHFSNGNIREPQKGLNVISWSLAVRHSFKPVPSTFERDLDLPPRKHKHEVIAFLSFGPRQLEFYDVSGEVYIGNYGLTYLMGALHLGYNYELTRRIKLSAGTDILYDGTNGQLELARNGAPAKDGIPVGDKIKLATFAGWESVVGNFSFVGNFIYVVAEKRYFGSTPAFKQRLGVKYYFHRNIFTGINIRATNFRVAEMLELNLGVRKTL